MMESQAGKQDIMRKVRAMLDKADSTPYEEEAATFRAKADELMTLYAIESWQLEMNKSSTEREKPEVREYEYGTGDAKISDMMAEVFYPLADLCRCKVGWYGWRTSKVVGFSTDLDYLDLLLTSVRMEITRRMVPQVDPTLSYIDNLYVLKTCGYKWQRIYEMLLPHFPEKFERQKAAPDFYGSTININGVGYDKTITKTVGVRFTKEYAKHCEEHGLPRTNMNPETYRKSFLQGFQIQLKQRVREMRGEQAKATEGHGLVLASRNGDLLEALYAEWPEKRPHEAGCDCEQCHLCRDPKCNRRNCVAARKPVRYRSVKQDRYDHSAMQAGRVAASQVDLSHGNNVGSGGNRSIR